MINDFLNKHGIDLTPPLKEEEKVQPEAYLSKEKDSLIINGPEHLASLLLPVEKDFSFFKNDLENIFQAYRVYQGACCNKAGFKFALDNAYSLTAERIKGNVELQKEILRILNCKSILLKRNNILITSF